MGTKCNAFRSRFTKSQARASRCGSAQISSSLIGSPYARRLRLEQLEDRRMLAVLTVQNDLDDTLANLAGDSQLSLREAIEIANNQGMVIDGFSSGDVGDTIDFAPALSGSTISLTDGELLVTQELSIDARPLDANVTIDAQLQSRIFHITANAVDYTLAGLTLTGGRTVAIGQSGGAIKFTGNRGLTLDQSIVSGNSTQGQSSPGGGIFSHGSLTLTQSTVSGNSTASSFSAGGGISANGAVALTHSTVSENSTSGLSSSPGGGIIAGSGGISLTQSTVSGNSTSGFSRGGGIYSSGPVTLKHSTVTDNHTSYSNATTGGGIWNFANPVIIAHSIVAGNTSAGGGDDLDPGAGTLTVDFSLIGDNDGTGLTEAQIADGNGNLIGNAAGSGIIDPQLGPLANNGGLTKTHAPLLGSPAIDAGDSIFMSPPDFDQRGAPFVRVFDGGVGGQRIDIGAYELQTVPGLNLVVDSALDEFDGNHSAGNFSLREAIVLADGNLGADVITFDAGVFSTPQTIFLTLGELVISETVNIAGTGVSTLTIDAQQNSRVLSFTATTGDLTLAGLTLSGGRTIADGLSERGGAIRFDSIDSLIILESIVIGNSTAGINAHGGGIYSDGAVTLIQSTVSGNSTAGNFAGGGGFLSSGDVTLIQSTVSGNNTAGQSSVGGGFFSYGATLTSSTVSGNSTSGFDGDGGGFLSSGDVTLTSSTVTDNHAYHGSATGGGIQNFLGSITITHSILAGNTAGGGSPDIDPVAVIFTVDFSLLGTAVTPDAGGSGNLSSDTPLLGPLADNGGPTETHALLAGSLAIDAGDPSFVGPPDFDQRTAPFVRVFDDPDAIGTAIDMGAYERQTLASSSLVVDITDDENDGNISPGDLSLREAIILANIASIGADTITFDAGVFSTPQTILLTLGEIEISESLTIDATAVANVTIDAQQNSRVLNFTATTGDLTLEGLTITGGQTTGSTEAGGGIRFFSDGTLTLNNSTVSGNDSADDGGGIYAVSGDVTLNSSTVSGNSTTGSAATGGGIFAFYGAVTLNNSTVSGNSTTGSSGLGGGIATLSGDITLANSTLSGNSSSNNGGGIFTYSSEVILTGSTVTGNSAVGAGGGIYVFDSLLSPGLVMENSIVALNTDDGTGVDLKLDSDGTFTVDFSLIGDTFSGLTASHLSAILSGSGNVKNVDPLLDSLADIGGPTQTHALLAGSLAIDAGDPSILFDANEFDQRGAPFVRVGEGRIDMGAYEVQIAVADSADFDGDGFVTGFDFLLWQLGFGTLAPDAIKLDGDADNDLDTDGDDLDIWESQFGQPAPAVAAISSPVIETFLAVEPSTAFQFEVTAALTSTPEESLASSLALPSFLLPANFSVRPNDPGLGFRFTTPRQVLVRAKAFTEHPATQQIDEAFRSVWHSWPEQNLELASDDFVRTTHGHSAKATQPADKAFAELADDEGFVGLGPPL